MERSRAGDLQRPKMPVGCGRSNPYNASFVTIGQTLGWEQQTNKTRNKIELHSQIIQLITKEVMGWMLETNYTVYFNLAHSTEMDSFYLINIILHDSTMCTKIRLFLLNSYSPVSPTWLSPSFALLSLILLSPCPECLIFPFPIDIQIQSLCVTCITSQCIHVYMAVYFKKFFTLRHYFKLSVR